MQSYRGRFAPSPTGPLHEGSLVAALASWLDAKAHDGQWLVRIEDVDGPRCVKGAAQIILEQLATCGLIPDEPPVRQSLRGTLYQQALDRLIAQGQAYPCGCSRKDVEDAIAAQGLTRERNTELVYPGTCRDGLHGKPARAWRFLTQGANKVDWTDRKLGAQQQDVEHEVGDFVLKRADGLWAYQLAVVADDADQGITHIVRGQDLADNTARQILLQRALSLETPSYLHTPLVPGADGQKLSKQNGATPLVLAKPLHALQQAGKVLGIASREPSVQGWLAASVKQWQVLLSS